MSVKAKVEAIIYAAEEPVTLSQLSSLLKDAVLAELRAEEEARLALNEIVTDGKPADDEDEESSAEELLASRPETAQTGEAPAVSANDPVAGDIPQGEQLADHEKEQTRRVKAHLAQILGELTAEYAASSHGVEVRQIAGGYRMGTKPEHHDEVIGFAKSLKPPVRLSLQALETLAVIAYKQPVTVPEISEIRGVDSAGVIATLLDRKLITTAGRKQVIGRPILYKTTKEFLLRFGLNNVSELPSMEEFEKLGEPQAELFAAPAEGSAKVEAPPSETTIPPTMAAPEQDSAPGEEGVAEQDSSKVHAPDRQT